MILRKPYAFLIKHFKIIHLFLSIILGIILYKTNLIYKFIVNYINKSNYLKLYVEPDISSVGISIFLLIAGTYTPYCMLAIKGVKGLILMIMIWLMSILGILYHILASKRKQVFETIIFVVMGWLCILGAKELFLSLGKIGLGLLVAGGITFTLGALVYSIPKIKYAHVFWHIFVMLGSILMFISIYCYI